MALSFPNPSRSYDAASKRVRFWGYDNAFEVYFQVEADALEKLCPGMDDAEAGFLDAFDSARARLHEVAEKMYSRSDKRSYSFRLAAKDL